MMEYINCEQRSPEWYQVRLGVPTSSCFDKIITVDEKPSKQRIKYMYQLAGEALSGTCEQDYTNEDIERGRQLEAEARQMYEFITGSKVQRVGFIRNGNCGCSPDGLIGKNGMLEIKCPKMTTHVGYLVDNILPLTYVQQVQGQLLIAERKWVDFMSYFPKLKPFIVRVPLNESFTEVLHQELDKFYQELQELIKQLREK